MVEPTRTVQSFQMSVCVSSSLPYLAGTRTDVALRLYPPLMLRCLPIASFVRSALLVPMHVRSTTYTGT